VAAGPASAGVAVTAAEAPRRRLTLFDVLSIGVNATVGSGVFTLPDDMQRAMGAYSPLAYLFCATLLLPVALCFAELAGRTDETGGAYVYAREAFGDKVGFLIGWFCWTATFVSWAANSSLFVALLGIKSPILARSLGPLLIVGLGAVNYFGVKPGAWTVNLVVIGKIAAILCFLAVAAFAFDPSRFSGPLPHGARGVATGVYLALFPLQGFEVAPVAAGETQNPRRNVPLATIGTLLLSALLFIVVQTELVGSYPGLANDSQSPLADAAHYLGRGIGLVVLIGSMVSIGGFNAGSALGSPRYAQAIAARRMLPAILARTHPRWSTPHVAIITTTALSAVLAIFFDYRELVGMSNITVVVQYLFACLAVPMVRRKVAAAGKPSGWVIPFGWVVPMFGAVGSLVLLRGADLAEVEFAAGALAIAAIVLFAQTRKKPA
jgi:amino acid transporter